MKITRVEPILTGKRYLFVKIYTDKGITGLGECGAWAYQRSTVEALKQMESLIVGKDPLQIEFIWNMLTRNQWFRGSVINAAISGIDIALWDIAGKFFDVPVYQLLGGKCRNKARIYVNVGGRTTEQMIEEALKLKNQGYTAIRIRMAHRNNPDHTCGEHITELIHHTEKEFAAVRAAVGPDMDIAIECHRGLRYTEAIELGKVLARYNLFFYEDPYLDFTEPMRKVIHQCNVPVATGERYIHIHEFDTLLSTTEVSYIRPDICMVGGITAARKIAANAEPKGINLIPHNPLGPVSTAACLHLDAFAPNFEIQEYPMHNGRCRLDEQMKTPFTIENGYVTIPNGPGLGIELIDDIAEKFPYQGEFASHMTFHEDGSMLDR